MEPEPEPDNPSAHSDDTRMPSGTSINVIIAVQVQRPRSLCSHALAELLNAEAVERVQQDAGKGTELAEGCRDDEQ